MRKGCNFEFTHNNWQNPKESPLVLCNNSCSKESEVVINNLMSFYQNENVEKKTNEIVNETDKTTAENMNMDTISSIGHVDLSLNEEENDNQDSGRFPHSDKYSNNNGAVTALPRTQFLPSYGFDISKPPDFSESSEHASFTDIKLANFHSRLKAETEEMRKWKEQTMLIENQFTKSDVNNFNEKDNTHISKCDQISAINDAHDYHINRMTNQSQTSTERAFSNAIENISHHQKIKPLMRDNNLEEIKANSSEAENSENKTFGSTSCNSTPNEEEYEEQMQNILNENQTLQAEIEQYQKNLRFTSEKSYCLLQENKNLQQDYNNKVEYCSELEEKIKNLQKELEKWRKSSSQETDTTCLMKEVENLESALFSRDLMIKELKEKLSNLTNEKDKAIKENVRLKEQQSELKNQMTHLLTFASATKRETGVKNKIISEFCEEQEKLSKITRNLQAIINENKSIFQNMSGELCVRNEKLSETMGHVKFMEDKLSQRESQYQSLRMQLEAVNSQFNQAQSIIRNIRLEFSEKNDQLMNEKIHLIKELDRCKLENQALREKNETLNSEVYKIEERKIDLKSKVEQIQMRFEEMRNRRVISADQYSIFTRQLEDKEKELNDCQIVLTEMRIRLEKAIQERDEVNEQLQLVRCRLMEKNEEIEQKLSVNEVTHMKTIEKLQDKLTEVTMEHKKYLKNSEKTINEQSKEITKLENQINELKHQKSEMVEYLYKLPTSSLKWTNFFQ